MLPNVITESFMLSFMNFKTMAQKRSLTEIDAEILRTAITTRATTQIQKARARLILPRSIAKVEEILETCHGRNVLLSSMATKGLLVDYKDFVGTARELRMVFTREVLKFLKQDPNVFQDDPEVGKLLGLINGRGTEVNSHHFEFRYRGFTKQFFTMKKGEKQISMVKITYDNGLETNRKWHEDEVLLTEFMCCESWKCLDPPLGPHPTFPTLFQFTKVGKGGSGSLAFPKNWLISTQGQSSKNIILSNGEFIKNSDILAKTIRFDLKARIPVETKDGSIIYSNSISLDQNTLISLKSTSILSAIDIYRDYIILDSTFPLNQLDKFGIPVWANENKVRLIDFQSNPDLYFLLTTQQVELSLPESISFAEDRLEDFKLRREFLSSNWRVWAYTINAVQRIRTGVHKGGGNYVYSIADSFMQYMHVMKSSSRNRIKGSAGFSSAYVTFKNLRSMAEAIDLEFPGIGESFIRWMMHKDMDLTGWKTWTNSDFKDHVIHDLGRSAKQFDSLYCRLNFIAANRLINTFSIILSIGKGSGSPEIHLGRKITGIEGVARIKFASIFNKFIEAYSGKSKDIITARKLDHLLSPSSNTDFLSVSGKDRRWSNFAKTDAITIDIITKMMMSLHNIEEVGDNLNNFNDPSFNAIDNFNKWMGITSNRFSDTGSWDSIDNKYQLRHFSEVSSYVGSRSHENRLAFPTKYGPYVLQLDSDLEEFICHCTITMQSDTLGSSEVPIGSELSPFKSIQGREVIRKWKSSLIPTRVRDLNFDLQSTKLTKACFWDVSAIFHDLTGVAIEGLGDNATKYRSGHDADAYQFLLDLIPIIHIVSQDRYITTYENNCLTIGKFTPLMTKSMWKGLTRAMFYNEIYAYSGSLKLSLRELLIQMKTNPYIYGISSNMANSQFAAFGFQSDCLISRNMDIWWFIFEHSNDPIICEKFMQQRNLI